MNLLALADSRPERNLLPSEVLVSQGASGGDLFILESGRLAVERDGVKIASVDTPGVLIGEMSVLLDTPISATVRAEGPATVRVIAEARAALASDPELTFLVARLVASRLDATSAVLVELTREHQGKTEQGILKKVIAALFLPADGSYLPLTRKDLFGGNDDIVRNFPGG